MLYKTKIVSLLFVILTIIPTLVVYFYPVIDWISGSILIIMILFPLTIFQLILSLIILLGNYKKVKVIIIIQAFILFLNSICMLIYIMKH